MPLTPTVSGYRFGDNEALTPDVLRRLIDELQITLAGLIGNSDLDPAAVQPNVTKPGAYFYGSLAGASNAYTLTLSPSLATLMDGAKVRGKFTSSALRNTGASTLNVDTLGVKNVKRFGGGPLLSGDLREDEVYEFTYCTTPGSGGEHWQLLNPSNPAVRDGTNNGSTGTAYNFTTSPIVTALYEGATVSVEIPIDSGNAPTLQIDGTAAKAIRKLNNTPLGPAELRTNQRAVFVYDLSLDVWCLLTASAVPNSTVGYASRNLLVTLASVTSVTVTADELILRDDTAGAFYRASTVNETAAITTSGLNGLDTGAEASATWYYIWIIYNGTSLDALLSASATAPTMPAGYTYKALAGAVFNNGSSSFEDWMEFTERKRFYSGERAIPATGAKITVAHNFGRLPVFWHAVLVCKTTELNYAVGDELPVTSSVVHAQNPNQVFYEIADTTNLNVLRWSADSVFLANKNTGDTSVAITDGNWRLKLYASL